VTDWACTRDNVTGLLWEVKVNDITQLRRTQPRDLFGEGATSTNPRFSPFALRLVRGGRAVDAFDLFPPPIPPPLFQSAASRKAHGGAGSFDLPLTP